MANERVTEGIVRDFLRMNEMDGQVVEEQVSQDPSIAHALQKASKHGPGSGRPEFIVTAPRAWADGVIIYECKPHSNRHESPRHKAGKLATTADISEYAVDGVLHYGKHLAKTRNVIAIAVSGDKKSLRVSTHRYLKGSDKAELLLDRDGKPVERLNAVSTYIQYFQFDHGVVRTSIEQLSIHSRFVHDFLRTYAKVTEPEKPLIVSAVLLALRHPPFQNGWRVTQDGDLAQELFEAAEKVVQKAISGPKMELMMAAYQFVRTHPELSKKQRIHLKGRPDVETSPLRYLIQDVQQEVLPFAQSYPDIDVIGQFYAEFLRYTGGDGKGLGIVLTPRHLTELFVQIAQITKSDTVLDSCAGTGGFLISAMIEMDRQAGDDAVTRKNIRESQLIGIEQRKDMFALCVSNMILRGDGRSNMHRGDCFEASIQDKILKPRKGISRPNKGLLNPPYGQKGQNQHELDFVKSMLDMLAIGGIGVAVVPMSCATEIHAAKERLLESHTLVAAMSLPVDLFAPVGTITCALVFRAHCPHKNANAPTWFGYWRDDGFVKVKHRGRLDIHRRWDAIRKQWLGDYRALSETPGRCVKRHVAAEDEWCAEAYMETDYSKVTQTEFAEAVRAFVNFKLMGRSLVTDEEEADDDAD